MNPSGDHSDGEVPVERCPDGAAEAVALLRRELPVQAVGVGVVPVAEPR